MTWSRRRRAVEPFSGNSFRHLALALTMMLGVVGAPLRAGPSERAAIKIDESLTATRRAIRDSWIGQDQPHANYGASPSLAVGRPDRRRALVAFDLTGLRSASFRSSSLVLTLAEPVRECVLRGGCVVEALPLLEAFAEGNGGADGSGGSGPGVTWTCATDFDIALRPIGERVLADIMARVMPGEVRCL